VRAGSRRRLQTTDAYVVYNDTAAEQSVERILGAVQASLAKLPADVLARATSLALSGQMHGCVLWKKSDLSFVSTLVTWEDRRCSAEFLADIGASASPTLVRPLYFLNGILSL
jgi:sugar (pentulose or hexulose) kinase